MLDANVTPYNYDDPEVDITLGGDVERNPGPV
jgi:hypothetical protein